MGAIAAGWTKFGLKVEGNAKKKLFKGHGVITGTLRRSIHLAQPGYGWRNDNVTASDNSPERGTRAVTPLVRGTRLMLQVGSGMDYALYIELGGSFEGLGGVGGSSFVGYRYLRGGLTDAKPDLIPILKAEVRRVFPGRRSAAGVPL